jgi:MoxR-like ATPase
MIRRLSYHAVEGHVLLKHSGLGKTLSISTISQIMSMRFSRHQWTPDLMPADIREPHFEEDERGQSTSNQAGTVFVKIVLADEINHASRKLSLPA